MVDRIGTTAGRVWQFLRDREETDVRRLPRILAEKPMVVTQALGWLAREGKLEYRETDGRVYVALARAERQR